jgi:O-acetyl-ADP-ribose deacetylase (regulator of RNase III)
MIHVVKGDMFGAHHHALVNTVNCDGVMGAGLARIFAKKYPAMERAYQVACVEGLKPGKMHVYQNPDGIYVINFPTVNHLKGMVGRHNRRSRRVFYEYVRVGLPAMWEEIAKHDIKDVAIPALGCGIVGLDWRIVLHDICESYHDSKSWTVNAYIYWPR